jgi:hypothetical protein
MSLPRTVGEILRDHTTLEVESIDRMYLNVYVPGLQSEGSVAWFFRTHRGQLFASSALMAPMSKAFVAAIEAFVAEHALPLITFAKGQRKDAVMAEHLARFTGDEGILFVGKAQEKTAVFRTERRRNLQTGQPYPWLVRSTAMVNHYYFYGVDRDFGPFFLKLRVLPVHGQALSQWARVRQAPARPARARLRGPGQRHSRLRRAPTAADAGGRAVGGEDRGPAAEVAGAPAASLYRPRSARGLSLRDLDPAGRV